MTLEFPEPKEIPMTAAERKIAEEAGLIPPSPPRVPKEPKPKAVRIPKPRLVKPPKPMRIAPAIPLGNPDSFTELDFLLTRTQNGDKPTLCTENICRILRTHTASIADLRYDEFRNLFEIKTVTAKRLLKFDWRPLEDADALFIQTEVSILFDCFQKVGKDMVYDAIIQVAKEKAYDSAQRTIESIVWDGVPRLTEWLTRAFNVPNDEYHQSVGANWLKGLVKRIIEPGCKFDYVLVLEGEQGIGKSSALSALGGKWYVETTMGADNKDFFMQFQGKAIIEFSEGESLSRTEVKRMKAVISTQVDSYRPPYGRVTQDFPRRCVFAMTTNQDEYLKDETGNRRWLPVKVKGTANVEWIKENRLQLFAEAYKRLQDGETVYEFPLEATKEAQAARRISDPNADAVIDWYQNEITQKTRDEGVTAEQVAKGALHSGFGGPLTRVEEMSVTTIMREVLKLEKRQSMVNGIRRRRWYPKDPLQGLDLKVAESVTENSNENF